MKQVLRTRAHHALRPIALALLTSAIFAASACQGGAPAAKQGGGAIWGDAKLVRPAELAAALADTTKPRPLLLHVGVRALYRQGAIPGSQYVGAGSDPAGIDGLLAALKDQPKDRDVVIYCGCCPAVHCPNMKPAWAAVRDAGFTNVHALWIEQNFDADWANHGYPTEKPGL